MSVGSAQVAAVRRFNRFYTARADLLAESHLASGFALAEVRVLFELAHRKQLTATDLRRELGLDAGYLSRLLRGFRKRGLVSRVQSPEDGRRELLSLTPAGRTAFAPLNRAASARVQEMLSPLSSSRRRELVGAMHRVERALGSAQPAEQETHRIRLRPPRPGDLGWVVQRHGELYAEEYALDQRFEALVATIVGEYVAKRDAARERCWIAELGGERVGSVFLVKKSETVAKLRLLLVEPSARGHGIGARLVRQCTTFARSAGYKSIVLWTQSELTSARKIYVAEGYELVGTERHRMFGKLELAETWTLKL